MVWMGAEVALLPVEAWTHYQWYPGRAIRADMLRILKHVLVEYGPERDAQIEAAVSAILETFPEAQLELAQGLLADDLLIEVRIPLHRLHEWPAVSRRAHAVLPIAAE